MTTIKTPVRLLAPGDVLLDPLPGPVGGATRYVVLCAAVADPGPVGLQLGRLGDIPAHLDRVATVAWIPDALVDVDRPDLTPEQAEADTLLDIIKQVVAHRRESPANNPGMARAIDIMQRLIPPAPPTLEEALAVLCKLCDEGAVGPQLNEAERLLHRARAAGVLPLTEKAPS